MIDIVANIIQVESCTPHITVDMERIKITNKRSENAEKELRISDVLRSFYDYHWKRTDVVEKFYDYHWKNPIKIA